MKNFKFTTYFVNGSWVLRLLKRFRLFVIAQKWKKTSLSSLQNCLRSWGIFVNNIWFELKNIALCLRGKVFSLILFAQPEDCNWTWLLCSWGLRLIRNNTCLDAENISLFFIQVLVTISVMKGTYLNTSKIIFFIGFLLSSLGVLQTGPTMGRPPLQSGKNYNHYSQDLHHDQLWPFYPMRSVTIRLCSPPPLFLWFQKHISHDHHHHPHFSRKTSLSDIPSCSSELLCKQSTWNLPPG